MESSQRQNIRDHWRNNWDWPRNRVSVYHARVQYRCQPFRSHLGLPKDDGQRHILIEEVKANENIGQ
jgi:hypothetical protein